MNVKSLNIGNKVYAKIEEEKQIEAEVVAITGVEIVCRTEKENGVTQRLIRKIFDLSGILISNEYLTKSGYLARSITTPNGATVDMVKQISVTPDTNRFFTISITNNSPGSWKVEIYDSNHELIGFNKDVMYVHQLQSFIDLITSEK